MPAYSEKSVLRLAEHVRGNGKLSDKGALELINAVMSAQSAAKRLLVDDLLAFATSAVRDARNSDKVLSRVREETSIDLEVLTGEEEARLTFLAVRRWFGWSAGQLLCLDIGGGSLEISAGMDEVPEVALSVPLGAGRLTREWFRSDPPPRRDIAELREHVEDVLEPVAARVLESGRPDRAVATSKTFRTLARLAGAPPSSAGLRARRILTLNGLRQLIGFISRISASDLADLEGVSPARAHQLLAGAVVAEAAMSHLQLSEVEICPWALREGVILQRLDWLDSTEPTGIADLRAARTQRAG